MKDALRCDKNFWRQREFNLIPINREGEGDSTYHKGVSHKLAHQLHPEIATDAAEKLANSLTGIPTIGTQIPKNLIKSSSLTWNNKGGVNTLANPPTFK